MNKVVTKEMRASDLPEAIRGDIDPAHVVEVIVRDLGAAHVGDTETGHFSRFFDKSRSAFHDTAEILRHVRAVRDGEEP